MPFFWTDYTKNANFYIFNRRDHHFLRKNS